MCLMRYGIAYMLIQEHILKKSRITVIKEKN